MKININPKNDLFKWGPIDAKILYLNFFTEAFALYSPEFVSWPDCLGFYFREKSIYILDQEALIESGKKNFNRFVLNDKKFKRYYRQWQNQLKQYLAFQKKITPRSLKSLSQRDFYLVYKKWEKYYLEFWRVGFLPEISNWGGEVILREKLEEVATSKNFTFLYERLSAPDKLSFYQKANLDLLKIYPYLGKKEFASKIKKYLDKYFWILNSYHHTQILDEKYFLAELKDIPSKSVKSKIIELENYGNKVKKEKNFLINKYKISKEIVKISNRLAFCVWWQDLRKYYIFLANHYIDLFLYESAERFSVSPRDLPFYTINDLDLLLKGGKKISDSEILKRSNFFMSLYSENLNKSVYISGNKAKAIFKKYQNITVNKKQEKITGVVVSGGKNLIGRVSVVKTAREVGKMRKGNILVTSMTSPEFIVGIKKAKALITDEGGMTCHAAIVSRELNIPCIVGAKVATQLLKSGDRVKVDCDRGFVVKLN